MKMRWAFTLALAVLLLTGCAKEQIQYRTGQNVGQANSELKVGRASGGPAASRPAPPDGPLYILHRWKEDDSLSFLAIYYTGKLESQADIEAANPDLTFTGRLPAGTPVWIPEEIVRPEVKKNFTPMAKGAGPDQLPDTPLDRGVIHKTEGQETLLMIATFYTGNAKNAQKLALYNPGLTPDQPLEPGKDVFIPSALILKDLQPDLVFVSRPRPKGLPPADASAVKGSSLGEEDLSQEPPSTAGMTEVPAEVQTPPQATEPKPKKVSKPKKTKKTQTAKARKPRKPTRKLAHKGSSKHPR